MFAYTMLGSSASYAGPGQACSGHLIRTPSTCVMLDAGNGTLANLARVIDPLTLDALFISHTHPDHFADVYAFQSLLRYAPGGPAGRLTVHAPERLLERMSGMLSAQGQADFVAAFREEPVESGSAVQIGDITITARPVEHAGPSYAFVVRCGRSSLCYTGDARLSPLAVEAARGADVLIAEATIPAEYRGRVAHMTGGEAGELARDAGVSTLVLTHLWPTADREKALEEAREAFSGKVLLGEELLTIDIAEARG